MCNYIHEYFVFYFTRNCDYVLCVNVTPEHAFVYACSEYALEKSSLLTKIYV